MADVFFSHPQLNTGLKITTGVDQISWGYQLNTQTYPTYGGEVVQILSAYTDNITIGGTVRSYQKFEEIVSWFLSYMQIATQGAQGINYTQIPVQLSYPERGWGWGVYPLSLPGFKYSREVVAPVWQVEMAVYEDDADVRKLNIEQAQQGIEKVTAGIGYREDNPFSDPWANQKDFKIEDTEKYYTQAADYFNKLIPAYMKGDYDSILGEIGSKPAFLDNKVKPGAGDDAGTQTTPKKKK